MAKYKYQMHVHTYPVSDCGRISPQELVQALYEGGYSGCVLTNHFFHGNTGVDRKQSWEAFVMDFTFDYIEAKQAGKKYGLDILFGLEEGVGDGLEILCYGITPDFLLSHPELATSDPKVWHDVMSSCGALSVQAHPFRTRAYITGRGALPLDVIDGVEVYNFCNSESDNAEAEAFAAANPGLVRVAGADAHECFQVCESGIETEKRITDEKELAEVLRSGEYILIK